jgi:hypothetical protein
MARQVKILPGASVYLWDDPAGYLVERKLRINRHHIGNH